MKKKINILAAVLMDRQVIALINFACTLTSLADAENVDLMGDRLEPAVEGLGEGKGKRKRVANQRYAAFWRHYDKDSYLEDHDHDKE